MNKRFQIGLILSASILGTSYSYDPAGKKVSKVTPDIPDLTNINKESVVPSSAYPFGIKTVVIDAGHGGKDPGCLGITTSQEKDVALAIALKLGKYIEEKTPDVKVVYTRKTDIFLELDERAAIANKNKADLFICIHANTACSINKKTRKKACNEEVFGTETYIMGLHKSNANLNVAKRENEAILLEKNYQNRYHGFDPNSETGYILLTMQQNIYREQSMNFAAKVQKQVKEKAGRVDKSVQEAGFLVLWKTNMPSVLIETEFLSNTESEKFIVSESGQDKLSRAIFIAFRQYKDEVEGRYAKYDDESNNELPYIVPPKEKKEKNNPKDSASGRKEPVIENETKNEIASKDSALVKNEMLPPVKEKTEVKSQKSEAKKDSISSSYICRIQGKDVYLINGKEVSLDSLKALGVIYKVQFMSSGQRIPLLSDKFKGLKDVGEYEDNGVFKYTAGECLTLQEAMQYRNEMLKKGHKDCFVVKFKDGKRMKN